MMKIGILTFWNVPNYGSYLQAYALQSCIQDLFPNDEVELISYLNEKHFRKYYSIVDVDFKYKFINPSFYKSIVKRFFNYSQIKKLRHFWAYYDCLKHTKKLDKHSLPREPFDMVVVGSDIVWDYSVSFFGQDRFLFGNSLSAKRIVAYAASFGTALGGDSIPSYVSDGLKKIDFISVRDSNSQLIVKTITNETCQIVADPTLLWSFSSDPRIINPEIDCEYVLVYGSFFSKEMIEEITSYSKSKGLKIVCINSLDDKNNWCDIQIDQDNLSPFEWLGYFKKASLVMTCTFHGLLFSIIYNRPIFFNPTNFIMSKAAYLIDKIGLKHVLLEKNDLSSLLKIDWQEQYKTTNSLIGKFRDFSLSYLKQSLNIKDEEQ